MFFDIFWSFLSCRRTNQAKHHPQGAVFRGEEVSDKAPGKHTRKRRKETFSERVEGMARMKREVWLVDGFMCSFFGVPNE